MTTIFRIGTSGWNYQSWRERFYPKECPQSKWLEYYSDHFDTVELNASFYRFFTAQQFIHWGERVPKNFKFVVKVPQYITHRKQLLDAEQQTDDFCNSIIPLKNKLGLVLLQLSPRTPYDLDRLALKIKQFGKLRRKLVVELRNEKWHTPEVIQLLRKQHTIYCNADSPVVTIQNIVTSDIAYIRLHGHTKLYDYNYSRAELKKIATAAQRLHEQGAKTVYIFFNNDVDANSVNNALYLKKLLIG